MKGFLRISAALFMSLVLVFTMGISSFTSATSVGAVQKVSGSDKDKGQSIDWDKLMESYKDYYKDYIKNYNKGKVKNGIKGQYYNDVYFSTLKLERIDRRISFDWNEGSPDNKIQSDTFSVRWTGQIQPRYSETYTFSAITDDGVRLYINNQLIINVWNDQGATENKGVIYLEAGKKYNIKMEYYENGGDACAKLLWASKSQGKEIVPNDRLFPEMSDVTEPPVIPPVIPPVTPPSAVSPVMASLAGYYNEDAMSYDTNRSDGNYDGLGNSYSANLLNMSPSYGSVPFSYGNSQNGYFNSISLKGQSIALNSGKYDSIWFVGSAANGNKAGVVKVNYSDGTHTDNVLVMKDWCTSETTGEKIVQTMQHRHTSTSDDNIVNYVFAYQFNLDKTKYLSSITLPDNKDMHILAVTMLPAANPVESKGNGLLGEYYDNANFTGYKLGRTDQTVNFDWGQGAPLSMMESDSFSVKWTGQVEPKYTETYTFYTNADDGTRLWVNGTALINDWNDHSATEKSGTITLTAGTKYNIRLEYYENLDKASVKLLWSSPSQAKQVIPVEQLYH